MINLIKLQCPNCGANLEVDAKLTQCFCQYCGTKLLIDDESRRDFQGEAKLTKAKTEQLKVQTKIDKRTAAIEAKREKEARKEEEKRREEELERIENEKWAKMMLPFLFTIIGVPGIFLYCLQRSLFLPLTIGIIQGIVLWGGYILIDKTEPKRPALGFLCYVIGILLSIPFFYTTMHG